ncbi:MAG: hypothetical protein R3199_03210 [Gemmatimonadota bacterium]|nr:hypothetical protein [Gemmatimonadota bacterium]
MPSDDRVTGALEAVAKPRSAYRSAVAEAVDAAGAILDARTAPAGERIDRTRSELGAFARGRVDPEAFAGVFGSEESLDPAAAEALERARKTLRELAGGEADFVVAVEPGGDLRAAVAAELAEAGRAFAAARIVEAVGVEGRPVPAGIDLDRFGFRRWNGAERRLAPPLVVTVDGADLAAGSLAEFLDGSVRIVLVVRGDSPPAALVRLITPGVLVMQTADPAELERVAAAPGPAVAALVPDSAALFVHDPAGGPTLASRLAVERTPEEEPRARLGGLGAFQQAEELRQLAALASAAPVVELPEPSPDGEGEAPTDPADRLAAWLLSRTDLSGLESGNGTEA